MCEALPQNFYFAKSLLAVHCCRGDFWALGLRPEEAFMCGFFALCRPNAAVQQLYYQPFWKPLLQPNVLSIGIQVDND
jgi:hypothetical protein